MNRALVMVGVRKSGILPELQAVQSALASMRLWATTQGIADESVIELSDLNGQPVHAADIRRSIDAIVSAQSYSQLIVYFCGHGVNNGQSEFWLLTDAPRYSGEAVNVSLSAEDAQHCGIPHVIFLSDACRTAPASINALRVTGISVFPNIQYGFEKSGVDRFYACRLGDAALEIADATHSETFEAVYTKVLTDVLLGERPDVIESDPQDPKQGIIRPWPLSHVLPLLVSQRVMELAGPGRFQVADADLSSDPRRAWVSSVPLSSIGEPRPRRGYDDAVARDLLSRDVTLAEEAAARLARSSQGRGTGTETLRVVGDTVEEVVIAQGSVQRCGEETFEMSLPPSWSLAAVRFSSGSCAIIPCLRDRSVIATLEGGQLVDIRYERLSRSLVVPGVTREQLVRRSELAAGLRFGVDLLRSGPFAEAPDLEGLDAGDDPSVSVYVAHWLHLRGLGHLIGPAPATHPGDVLSADDRHPLFDPILLAGRLEEEAAPPPGFPLLARGWALVHQPDARDMPPRQPSFWTLFAADHFEWMLRHVESTEDT